MWIHFLDAINRGRRLRERIARNDRDIVSPVQNQERSSHCGPPLGARQHYRTIRAGLGRAAGLDDWVTLSLLRRTLEQARDAAASAHLVAQPRVTGARPLSWRIRRDLDLVETEADDRGSFLVRTDEAR
ncbi:MAG: repair exonuclease, partial [Tardiphaga sp.]|nr:repair exonuclease [Tardiphaga sp.]